MEDDGGLSRFQKRMRAIPQAVKDAVRPAMEKSAAEIVATAKALCPVDEGDLRNSIGWTWGAAPQGSIVLASSTAGEMTITIYAGNDEAFWARWVEFGTQAAVAGGRVSGRGDKTRTSLRTHSGTAAQPFFYPAFRLNKKRASGRIKRAVRKAVKDNWGRG
jgi:HK97 gp10 family phage protein